ncbi:MAG TPA: type VI secretion system baseplate subunit TssK [Caldimonas sp.]
MSWRSPVVWSQGMFLQPHHFQQEARFTARVVDARARCLSPYAWGFAEIVLDDALLALGRLGVARASGVFPDGTPFSIPQLDAPPEPLEIAADLKGEVVYLAVALSREGVTEVDFDGMSSDELCRLQAVEESVRDHTSASDEAASIQVGRLRLRLVRAKEATDAYALLGVAHVIDRRSDKQVLLDRGYIPPEVVIDATDSLAGSARLLHGLVAQRSQALAGRMGQLSHGVSELADFLMLLVLNRAEPLLRQHAQAPSVHPFTFFTDCLQLAGELATFASSARRPIEFPLYRHDDLRGCFTPLIDELRKMLSVVLEQNAVQIPLVDRTHGVSTAVVADMELVQNGVFVLAVNAQLPPEQLRPRFMAQTKLGPVERIRDLVNLQLPGIGLQSLPVAPRQLPFHAGHFYFELDRNGELWRQFQKTGNLALHIAGDFPGLELELWAIRQ